MSINHGMIMNHGMIETVVRLKWKKKLPKKVTSPNFMLRGRKSKLIAYFTFFVSSPPPFCNQILVGVANRWVLNLIFYPKNLLNEVNLAPTEFVAI